MHSLRKKKVTYEIICSGHLEVKVAGSLRNHEENICVLQVFATWSDCLGQENDEGELPRPAAQISFKSRSLQHPEAHS